jgi:hypothetical protein
MSILGEVPQVSHGEVPVLTIVYLIAFLGFAGAAAVLFVTMRNASRAYNERWTVRPVRNNGTESGGKRLRRRVGTLRRRACRVPHG